MRTLWGNEARSIVPGRTTRRIVPSRTVPGRCADVAYQSSSTSHQYTNEGRASVVYSQYVGHRRVLPISIMTPPNTEARGVE